MREDSKDSRGRWRSESWSVNDQPSMTVQSDAEDADITKILRKFKDVGIIDNLRLTDGMFLDVTEFGDFADVQRQSKIAEVEFMKLPSKIREIFHHDVAEWLDTAHDQEKRNELVRKGIVEAPETVGAGVGSNPGDADPAGSNSGSGGTTSTHPDPAASGGGA